MARRNLAFRTSSMNRRQVAVMRAFNLRKLAKLIPAQVSLAPA